MKAKVKRERRMTPMSHGLMPHGNFRRSRDEKLNLQAHVAHRFELAIGNNDGLRMSGPQKIQSAALKPGAVDCDERQARAGFLALR